MSAPSARARSIPSITSRALASMAPTVGFTWASATRTRLMPRILALSGRAFTVEVQPGQDQEPAGHRERR